MLVALVFTLCISVVALTAAIGAAITFWQEAKDAEQYTDSVHQELFAERRQKEICQAKLKSIRETLDDAG